MFLKMIKGLFARQWKKMIMIALTIALGASLATAMLNVMMDVGDKVNQELKAYGANITVVPKSASVVSNLYEMEGDEADSGAYLREDELGKIKTIFWAFNIVDFAPFIDTTVALNGTEVKMVGTWLNHHMDLPTGETLDTGVQNMRTWWTIKSGAWLNEQDPSYTDHSIMVGQTIAEQQNLAVGDTVHLTAAKGEGDFVVSAIFESGDDADGQIYASMDTVQELAGLDGYLTSIEVSAITTPDNELAQKAAKDPSSLTIAQYETWYCTAYVSSICYQIQEVITDSVAQPVRQVADSEGSILEKTELLMILITVLSLVGSALGITNLVTASVMERSKEIGLMKAVGATNRAITGLLLTEIIITAIVGGVVGYFAGFGFAQIIGQSVFGSSIDMKGFVIPIVAVLILVVTLAGSIPAIHTLLRLKPAEVLHGR